MTLPRVSHEHGYLPNTKFSQAFKISDFDQGTNHELILKYQVQPFVHAGTHIWVTEVVYQYQRLFDFISR